MKKLFSNIFLSFLLGLTLNFNAFATSTVQFENGAENFVFYSDSAWSETDLFGGLKNLMPGDRLSEDILIKNSAPEFDYVKIYLRAEPTSASSSAFLSQLTLNLYKDSELISSSSASDSGSLETNFNLGTFNFADEVLLTAEILAPTSLTSEFADTSAEISWVFTAEAYKNGEIVPSNSPTSPDTGALSLLKNLSAPEILTAIFATSLIITGVTLLHRKAKSKS